MKQLPILLLFITIMLSSCGNTEQSKGALQINDSLKIKDSLALKASHAGAGNSQANANDNLMYTEIIGEIKLGLEGKKVISMMGQPDTKTAPELWGADNAYHQEWNYTKQGIKLDMMGPRDDSIIVDIITITEPCTLKTKRGIGIGSPMQEVMNAYKQFIDTTTMHAETIIAGTVYGGVFFDLKNNKVQSIFIGAAAD